MENVFENENLKLKSSFWGDEWKQMKYVVYVLQSAGLVTIAVLCVHEFLQTLVSY